nr:MAG TPA: hypothetical protein [Caudoviricetes sp.]
MTRNYNEFIQTIRRLSGETDIHPTYLMEEPELLELIKNGESYEDLLDYVNGSF